MLGNEKLKKSATTVYQEQRQPFGKYYFQKVNKKQTSLA